MSELADAGPSLRDQIEASVHSHSAGPDVDSIVSGATEQRDREIRNRDTDRQRESRRENELHREGNIADRRRANIRAAIDEEKVKAAKGPAASTKVVEAEPGPPKSWDLAAKAAWRDLPAEVRAATLRDQSNLSTSVENNLTPHFQAYQEIDKTLAPFRQIYSQHGLSDAAAVSQLMQWEGRFRNPQTRAQAFHELARQYGSDLHQILGMAPQPQQQHYESSPEGVAQANRELGSFAKDKPHFAAVRETMGLLIARHGARYVKANGSVNLDQAYKDACKAEGVSAAPPSDRTRRPAGTSSGARIPTGNAIETDKQRGVSVRDSLRGAFRASTTPGRL